MQEKRKKTSLKEYILEKCGKEIAEKINRSFERVGSIAIIEVDSELEKYTKDIGEGLLHINPAIKTVLKKSGIHEGEFRTQNMDFVCGENTKETEYLENGVRLMLDVEKVYFSSKLSTERANLCSNIDDNAKVLVMFSGCGPYTFNILKKNPNVSLIDSVEINPLGHKYALKNLELNRNLIKKSNKFKESIEELKEKKERIDEKAIVKEINNEVLGFYNGDVREIVNNELKEKKYSVIFMPLPKDAELFLDCTFKVSDKNCLVHMYDFLHENEFPHKSEDAVKKAAKKFGREVEIVETRKVGQYSPRKYRVCCDFIVK